MANKRNKVLFIIFLVFINLYLIYDLSETIIAGSNVWIPIIMFLIEIALLVIYRYVGQYGEKMG